MVIYLDQAFAVNGLVDYLLLVLCADVTEAPLRRGRILLSAALGGLYAALALVPGFAFLQSRGWALVFGGVLCLTAFGPGRGILRRTAVLWLLGAAFFGLVLVLTELFSAPASLVGGRVYYPVSMPLLVLTAGGAFSLIRWGLARMTHHGGDVATVRVTLMGRTAEFTALRDTGNTLRDPLSGLPVLVAEGSVLRRLLPEARLEREALRDPSGLLEPLKALGLRPRLIPYRSVGVPGGLLLALRPEDVQVDGAGEALLLAFSPDPVSDGNGCEGLLGGAL